MSELMAARIMKGKSCIDKVPQLPWDDKIAYLAYAISQRGGVTELPLKHSFEDGLYLREIFIPADTIFIGRVHILGHLVELLQGKVVHITEHGRRIVSAPYSMFTRANYQTVCYTITDVIARSVHPNEDNCKNIDIVEARAFCPAQEIFDRGQAVMERIGNNVLERDTLLALEL
jgi:hypothetical protein